ncbi:MAG TPA: MMPL family transporter [Thermomicrobiales bacterium]|nr:MMPL family transporter [Thermomicrobiales bacterium]
MFGFLGRMAFRLHWLIVGVWAVVLVAAVPAVLHLDEVLKVGGFSSPEVESARAREMLERKVGLPPSQMVVLYQSDTLPAHGPAFLRQVEDSLRDVRDLPFVTDVLLPSEDDSLIAPSGRLAYALVGLNLPPEDAQRAVEPFERAMQAQPDLEITLAGAPVFYADIETVSQRDLRRAELIAVPFALVALLLVFGSVVAAVVPLLVGGLSVAAVLGSLYWIAQATDLSIFVLNLASMLGLGLAVDYSLFVTSRYREELARNGGDVGDAVEQSLATAGRAVFFSGLTVLIGLSGLSFFSFMFLRSVGIAGVVVVVFATLAALTLLPAVLSIIGTRIDRLPLRWRRPPRSPGARTGGLWARWAGWVMAHALMVLMPTLAFLLLLGSPFLDVNVSSPDGRILPADLPSRQGFDLLSERFGPGEISPMVIAVESSTSIYEMENLAALHELTTELESDPRVDRVQSIVSYGDGVDQQTALALLAGRRGLERLGVDTGLDRLTGEEATMVLAYTRAPANEPSNKELLRDIRDLNLGGDLTMLVDGGTAEIVDVVDLMYHDFPRAVLWIVIATYIVLLVLFRSLILPLKAIVMNMLSILASYGALVFIFQEGHFSGLLRFTPLGFVEASLPVIMFCILFGLSMDYEVFLLSRVREEWERTGDNGQSVAMGLERSGRIITSAALIVVVVTASFVTADVILIKALGLGIALAVLLDATVVRALLVPATMRLLGKWNWWLPAPLGRILPAGSFVEESAYTREIEVRS